MQRNIINELIEWKQKKSSVGLEQLRKQLAAFYAKQVDDEMDALWDSGEWNEKRLQELRGSHFRTPYKK